MKIELMNEAINELRAKNYIVKDSIYYIEVRFKANNLTLKK